ncbi:MAG TPA: DHH family phosphoesterase [Patescibacteria group bacterium]|nr:DHH family phosphoesterase [Patescibacteria group bacterium]
MKKWEVKYNEKYPMTNDQFGDLIKILLQNRGIKTEKEIEEFLHPDLSTVTPESVGIDLSHLKKTLKRLQKAFDKKEEIIIFGDYDVDGITGTAILWETLYSLGFNVLPYIPHRVDEGYGLSIKGIENLLNKFPCTCHSELVSESIDKKKKMLKRAAFGESRNKRVQHDNKCSSVKLIITVDNGIVANEAVDYANSLGIDVIITDHHLPEGKKQPNALAIVHTTNLCGAGVAYLLSKEIRCFVIPAKAGIQKKILNQVQDDNIDTHLELATLGTIADLVPLTAANRTIVKIGLEKLRKTKRPGLLSLFEEAAIDPKAIGTYEVGFIIAPRLNAAGRIESAMDSLRLLCTKEKKKAFDLATNLGRVNRQRQEIMKEATEHAIEKIKDQRSKIKKIIFLGDKDYNPGVIGLVAGKLVEQFYRPAIVLSVGDTHAKASVRSIAGVNIIEFLRTYADMYVNVGGHPMAAGFTVAVDKMSELQEKLETLAEKLIGDDLLQRSLMIDCELPLSAFSLDLYKALQQLAPFGMKNPEPVFVSRGVMIEDMRILGKDGKHLKLRIGSSDQRSNNQTIDAIAFGMGHLAESLKIGDIIDIAYTLDENKWNGNVNLQLKVKDIQILSKQ